MSLEITSNAAYHDTAKLVKKSEALPGDNMNQQGQLNIRISEVPVKTAVNGTGEIKGDPDREKQENADQEKKIKDAVTRANNQLGMRRTYCEFSYDEATKRVSIKVFDEDTKEVIREIQPEETLEMVKKMWELAGILIDERR